MVLAAAAVSGRPCTAEAKDTGGTVRGLAAPDIAAVAVAVAAAVVAAAVVAVVVALIVVDWEGYIERCEVGFVERCAMRYMNARLDVLQHSSPHHEESVVPYFRRSCLEKPDVDRYTCENRPSSDA